MSRKTLTFKQRQKGISLLEALIATLVLSTGLLSLAAMQSTNVKNNQGAYQRSYAVSATYSLIDRIQLASAHQQDSQKKSPADYVNAMPIPTASASPPTMAVPSAPANDIVANDRTDWLTELKQNLGASATGGISCTLNNDCVIRVIWNDSRGIALDSGPNPSNDMIVDVQVRIR